MQLLLDFLPVLAFFIAYKVGGIYVATKTLMVAMTLMCAASWLRTRKVSNMLLISTILALALGAATLLLRDSSFVKWKLTITDWLFALGFLLAPRFLKGQTLVQRMMGEQLKLTDAHWRTLNWMWISFFFLLGAVNIYVMYNFDEATWFNFKMFGTLGATLVFVVLQGIWLAGKLPKDPGPAARTAEQNPSDRPN
jgi:intracellular septation protein